MKKLPFLLLPLLLLTTFLGGCDSSSSPPDLTPPALSQSQPTNPANGATNVPLNTAVTLTFDEPIDPASVTSGTFTVSTGGNPIQGTVTVSGSNVVFQPAADLAPNSTYVGTLTPGVTDMAGNAMAKGYTWSFQTAAAADTTPPTVSGTTPPSPADGAVDVPVDTPIVLTFSEPIAASSVTSGTFTLSAGGTTVTGSITVQGSTITFQPQTALDFSTAYTATASAGITDLAGNPLGSPYSWSFTTAAAPDTTPPTVSGATPPSPADGSVDVATNTAVTITFSEPMAAASFTSATFFLGTGGSNVSGSISVNGATAIFQPAAALSAGTTYTATVKGSVTDLAGNPLGSDQSWSFTTAAAPAGPAWGTATMLNPAGTTTYSNSNDGSLVKMDGQGNAIAIWSQFNPNLLQNELWSSRYTAPTASTAGSWSTPAVIVPAVSGQDIYDPALAVNGNGQAILVWRDYVSAQDQSNLYSRYFDPSSGWGAQEAVNTTLNGMLMKVVLDSSGVATMAWERSKPNPSNPSVGVVKTVGATRYVPGSGWGSEVLLEDLDYTGSYSYVHVPSLALDSSGNVTAVWVMDDSTGYYLHASRLVGGSWSAPVTIYSTPDYIQSYLAGADDSGNVTVTWQRNGDTNGSNSSIWATRFTAQAGTWSTPVQLANPAGLGTSDLAVDPAGTAMVVWDQKPSTDMELLARRYTPGSGWGTTEPVVGTVPNTVNDPSPAKPRIAATSGGVFWAGWQMPGQVGNLSIYANSYVPASGWGTPTSLQDLANVAVGTPEIDANSAGDVIMTWGEDVDNGTWASIYH